MAVYKILLYYAFSPVADPEAVRLWQRELCERLGLTGRIILSKDGINGTVGGELSAVKRYLRTTREFAPFHDLDVKWSEGTGHDFPRLSVRVRDELVSFGAPGEIVVDSGGVVGGGTRLAPDQLHALVAEKNVTFFDGRNPIEAAIGRFDGAIVPEVETTRDFVSEIESGKYDHLKDEPIVTYCTGGIRCEVLSSLMINRGFREVYQLDGGIVRYGEQYGDSGLWKGSLYVFDKRMSVNFSEHPQVIGECHRCSAATSRIQNCSEPTCRTQLVTCEDCAQGDPIWCERHVHAHTP